jgi:hypothetical protein
VVVVRPLLLVLAATACSPEIASGSYLCGEQGLCPDDMVCSPGDGTCVLPGETTSFACSTLSSDTPNDATPAQAVEVPNLSCIGQASTLDDCIDPGDTADWRTFTIPATCNASVSLQVKVAFGAAFQPLAATLTAADGTTTIATSTPCTATGAGNETAACITTTGSAGTTYDLEIAPTGSDCGGACNFNTYTVTIIPGAP